MLTELVVIGGGAHARVVIEAALSDPRGWRIVGFVDPEECAETCERFGVRRLGDDDVLCMLPPASAILGFGAIPHAAPRMAAPSRLDSVVSEWARVIHGSATLSPTASIGEGTVVMADAVIQTGARIGAHVIVNSRAVIEHDVIVGDHVQVGPGAVIGGGATIGRGAYIGLGASLRDHVRIGEGAVIGMGSTVVKDVPSHAVVMGGRAR